MADHSVLVRKLGGIWELLMQNWIKYSSKGESKWSAVHIRIDSVYWETVAEFLRNKLKKRWKTEDQLQQQANYLEILFILSDWEVGRESLKYCFAIKPFLKVNAQNTCSLSKKYNSIEVYKEIYFFQEDMYFFRKT